MTAIRHRRRDRKRRAEEISLVGHDQRQRDLQVIVGAGRSIGAWFHGSIAGYSDTPAVEGGKRRIASNFAAYGGK